MEDKSLREEAGMAGEDGSDAASMEQWLCGCWWCGAAVVMRGGDDCGEQWLSL